MVREHVYEVLLNKVVVHIKVVVVLETEQELVRAILNTFHEGLQDPREREWSWTTASERFVEPPVKRLRMLLRLTRAAGTQQV
jgi:hypothetical protein